MPCHALPGWPCDDVKDDCDAEYPGLDPEPIQPREHTLGLLARGLVETLFLLLQARAVSDLEVSDIWRFEIWKIVKMWHLAIDICNFDSSSARIHKTRIWVKTNTLV